MDDFQKVIGALWSRADPKSHLQDYARAISYWRFWSQDPERAEAGQWPKHSDLRFFLFQNVMLGTTSERDQSEASSSAALAASRLDFVPNIRRRGGASRPEGGRAAAYVQSIVSAKKVPTRLNNLHDFANALTWAQFPRTKWVLYCGLQREYECQARDRQGGQSRPEAGRGRTPRADRLTLLDEAGVMRLGGRNGHRDVCFGHALIEHLARGGPAVNAPVWEVPAEEDADDSALSACLSAVLSTPAPLPALGSCWIGGER